MIAPHIRLADVEPIRRDLASGAYSLVVMYVDRWTAAYHSWQDLRPLWRQPTPPQQLITITEAARQLDRTWWTIDHHIKHGHLQSVNQRGRRMLYAREVEALRHSGSLREAHRPRQPRNKYTREEDR